MSPFISDIRDKLNLGSAQQPDERLKASVGMAGGEEGKLHVSPSGRRVFKRAAFMGRDVICLVALDFVLRIVFRGAMHMTLVVEVSAVDGNNGARHPASLGIPANMIAKLESLCHFAAS
jgi:hypothetical protein